jgi:GNAT superfamily N-acetyltransferase
VARPDLKIEALSAHHDRDAFSCGVDSLDRYLHTQASQDVRRLANGVFVLTELSKPNDILGYYTLCATALAQGDVPDAARKHLPRYPLVSAVLVGRLAISQSRQGEGLGSILLADIVRRTHASAATIGASMLLVDALSERAAAFYEQHGFIRLPESLRLVLPMSTIMRMVKG